MTFNPHPIVMNAVAGQRRAELQAEADLERLAKRAMSNGASRRLQPVPDFLDVIAIVLGLALMVAGSAAAAESRSQDRHEFVQAAASVTVQGLAEDDSGTSAVQKVREAAN